jgi:phage gpG-like protein
LKTEITEQWFDQQFYKLLEKSTVKRMEGACILIANKVKSSFSGGSMPNVRSGRLRASISYNYSQSGMGEGKVDGIAAKEGVKGIGNPGSQWPILTGVVGSNVVYARVQELGGTISKKDKMLTIPLDAAKTASGVSRGGARSFSDTFVKRSKAGNLIIFQSKGKDIVPLFVLKDKVVIPARPYLRPALEWSLPKIQKLFNNIQGEISTPNEAV